MIERRRCIVRLLVVVFVSLLLLLEWKHATDICVTNKCSSGMLVILPTGGVATFPACKLGRA